MKFWGNRKSAPRSWEEITAPKTDEISEGLDNVCENEGNDTDNAVNGSRVDDVDKAKNPYIGKKLRKNSLEKFGKMIDNLEFDPTVYYGWGDGKVDAWMEKLTKVWNVIASVLWFVFGSVTFAPILFTANKLDKFFNDKKKSFLIATAIYVFIALFAVFVIIF